jgi:magnesium-transporting ATPase (P-type)
VPFVLYALSRGQIPLALTVIQVLAVDLGTDMVPALALGAESPEPDMMNHPPRNRNEHVITRSLLLRSLVWLGLFESALGLMAFYFQYWSNGYWGHWLDLPIDGDLYRSATAMTLAAVVAGQIGNLFAHRTERASLFRARLGRNRLLWIGIATELALVVLIVYAPPFQSVFKTAAFAPYNWLFLLALTPTLLLADELRKLILRWREGGAPGAHAAGDIAPTRSSEHPVGR